MKSEIPSDYLRPPGEHPLVEPSLVEDEYIRFKVRVAFEASFCDTFEQGTERLLDEIGPRPGTLPKGASTDATALVQCDAEEADISDRRRGVIEFGVNADALPGEASLPIVLAIASYVAAYSFILEYHLLDIKFPTVVLNSDTYPGPKFGPDFVATESLSTRLGLLIKPRFAADRSYLRKFVGDAGSSGIDYLTDDELTVGGKTMPFRSRVELIMRELRRLEQANGKRPVFIANIMGDYESALERAWIAKELGADGVMVNAFAMGYDLIGRLARDSEFSLGIISNTLGRGVVSKGPAFRVSAELMGRLARLAGADGVYTGPMVGLIDSSQNSVAQFRRALTQPYGRGCKRRAAAAVMSGGVGLPELLKNDALYRGPLFLSIGYQYTEARLAGVPAPVIVECIRTIWNSVRAGGLEGGRGSVYGLAKKGGHYKQCIQLIRAEQAVSE